MAARIVGKAGAFYLNTGTSGSPTWVFAGDLYDWEVTEEGVTLDASVKGDAQERYVFSHLRGRLTAKRWVQQGGTFFFGEQITTGKRYDWAVVTIDPNAYGTGFNPSTFTDNTNPRAQGTGFFTRVQMHNPRGLVEDNMEMVIDTIGSIH